MSGPKQHYIPQSFQRPFQIDDGGKTERVWCYRKEQKKPFAGRISDVAAERYFYSEKSTDNAETLDEIITNYENRLAHLLKQLRALSECNKVPNEVAAEVIAHLTTRAKSIRNMTRDMYSGLLQGISNLLEKGFDVEDFPAAPISNSVEAKLKELIREHPEASDIDLLDKTLSRIAYAHLRENADTFLDNAGNLLEDFLNNLEKLDLRAMHSSAFKTMFPENVFKKYSEMNWEICELHADKVILPDCIGIASEDGVNFEAIMGGAKNARIIIAPITPHKVLIASNDTQFKFDIEKFNNLAASCSSELFISDRNDESLKALQQKIGTNHKANITQLIDDSIREFTVQFSGADEIGIPNAKDQSGQFNIKVSFPNDTSQIANEAQIKKVANEIISVFEAKSLSKLASIHFDDQTEALRLYTESKLPDKLVDGSQRLRGDGICSIVPNEIDAEKHEIHINYQVFDLFMKPDQKTDAIDYIKKAESDLLLTPIFERFDDDEFDVVDQILIVPAIRSLKAFNRILSTNSKDDGSPYLAIETKSELTTTWDKLDLEKIKDRHENASSAVEEILERMSYSMVVLSTFVAQSGSHIENTAAEICDSDEFYKWIMLFDKDMRLALRWLNDRRDSDAALIAAAHLERLMFGTNIMFEPDTKSGARFEFREGFPENVLPVPFNAIIDAQG